MLVKLSGLVTEMAGSVGGLTFQRGQTGTSARSKPIPVLRRSTYSITARQRLAYLNRLWSQLDPSQRDAWKTFSGTVSWFNRFGDPVPGDGYKAFLKCNAASNFSAGNYAPQPIQSDPPVDTTSVVPAAPSFTSDPGGGNLLFSSSDSKTDATTRLFFFGSPVCSPGRNKWFGNWKYLDLLDPEKDFPVNLETPYFNAFGYVPVPEAGQSAFLRVVVKNEGSYWPGAHFNIPLTVTP